MQFIRDTIFKRGTKENLLKQQQAGSVISKI